MPQRLRCSHCNGTFDTVALGTHFTCPAPGSNMQLIADATAHETLCRDAQRAGSQKRNFLQAQVRLPNFVPTTRRGNFDAVLDMAARRLTIRVYMHCNFVVSGGATLTNWWGPLEKSTFKTEFNQAIAQFWNNHARLVCTKQGWTDITITPHFEAVFQDAPVKANFLVSVNRDFDAYGPGGLLKCGGAFVGLQQIVSDNPGAQTTATFQAFNPRTVQLGVTRSGVARRERERLEALFNNAVQFDANSAVVPAARIAALTALAGQIRERTPSAPRTPIILTGDVAAGESPALAQQRATALETWLQGQGHVDNTFQKRAANPSQGRAEVALGCDRNFENNVPDWDYNISAHEFGHLIGLPDEYEDVQGLADPQTNPKRIQRLGFDALVLAAGVRPPDFGSNRTTTSIMSFGHDILPCHLVTAWEALGKLSKPYLSETDWRITVQ